MKESFVMKNTMIQEKNWLTVPPGGFQLDRVTNGEGSVFTNVFKHLKVGF